ncbi:choice-of-anchor A family protein [Agarivorans sp. QJM3NY_29]|uniref:choice-of-anchor A family protein n=1 Tax=unclassified Agarivorans TaxID=2636026 RepID=UPI003D7D708A
MFYEKFGQAAVIGVALLYSAASQATPLSDYNLILTGDYHYQGGEVEGRTIIGGDLNAAGQSPTFAIRETTVPFEDTVTVAGNINASNINLNAGSLTYGGNLNVSNVNLNGGGSSVQKVTAGEQAAMASNMAGLESQLRADSAYFSGLTANGSFSTSHLSYSGSDDMAVFNVNFSEVFAQNNSLSLAAGSAKTVVINVAGSAVSVAGGVNLTSGFGILDDGLNIGAANILWNFYEAETIDFNSIAFVGAILAMDADLVGGAVFDGSVAAESFTGAREFHNTGFNWQEPQIPATVSEGSSSILFALGLGFVVLSRRRNCI